MKLWTIQGYGAYEKFLQTGNLTADENYLFGGEDMRFAYDWMAGKMKKQGIDPPKGINYPVWAWYQKDGKRKRRDLREWGYANRGEKMVQLTIEIDDKDVLLSDFNLFNSILNYWYLPEDEIDDETFEEEYTALGYEQIDFQNFNIQTQEMKDIRRKIVESWEKVFDLEKEDNNWLYGRNSDKSIQATFWKLKSEQVLKAEVFIAK